MSEQHKNCILFELQEITTFLSFWGTPIYTNLASVYVLVRKKKGR
jgi:hypothetical protein